MCCLAQVFMFLLDAPKQTREDKALSLLLSNKTKNPHPNNVMICGL